MELSKDEVFVRKQLEEIYPQLIINSEKTCGYHFDKYGLDLLSVCITFFLEKPIEVQLKTIRDGKLENFITFMMAVQMKSGSSHFYHKYRKHHTKQRELFLDYDYGDSYKVVNNAFNEPEHKKFLECVLCEVEKLDPYLKMIVKERVMNGRKYTELVDKYYINYPALKKDQEQVLKKLKEKCKHLIQPS
jgi:hypothetical protein